MKLVIVTAESFASLLFVLWQQFYDKDIIHLSNFMKQQIVSIYILKKNSKFVLMLFFMVAVVTAFYFILS